MKKVDKEILELSNFLWEQEIASMKNSFHRDYTELIEVLDPLIKSGKVLYSDFIEMMANYLEEYAPNEEHDTLEERSKAIDKVIKELVEYYKQF